MPSSKPIKTCDPFKQDRYVFSTSDSADYFELMPKITAPTIAVMRPCPPFEDPADVYEVGRLRWCADRDRVEFRGNDLPLTAADVACIARAIDTCATRERFDRYTQTRGRR